MFQNYQWISNFTSGNSIVSDGIGYIGWSTRSILRIVC